MSTRQLTGRAPLMMVEAYWEGLRNGRLVPNRSEVHPNGLGAAIDHAFLLERIASGFARLRVAGTRINDLMGMETRGMPISALFQPGDRTELSDLLEPVFMAPGIAELTLDDRGGGGTWPTLTAEMLLMPLRDDAGQVSRALGCLVYDGHVGAPPRRFRILDSHQRRLPNAADCDVFGEPDARRLKSVQHGFSEDRHSFEHGSRRNHKHGRPNLRLVKSDDAPDKT